MSVDMLKRVSDEITEVAEGRLCPDELDDFLSLDRMNRYEERSSNGELVGLIARAQHYPGPDGTGGGIKLLPITESVSEKVLYESAENQAHALALLMALKSKVANLSVLGDVVKEVLSERRDRGILDDIVDLDGIPVQDVFSKSMRADTGGSKAVGYLSPEVLASPEKTAAFLGRYAVDQYKKGVFGVGMGDRAAPDMSTNGFHMKEAGDRLVAYTKDEKQRAAFTGRPVDAYGLEGREAATGFGMMVALREHLRARGYDVENKEEMRGLDAAVQGGGNVGQGFIESCKYLGINIVAVSDAKKTVVRRDGGPLDDSFQFEGKEIGKNDRAHYVELSRDDLFKLPVDIVALAAAPGSVTDDHIASLSDRVSIFVSGANDPFRSDAKQRLEKDRDEVEIIPDIVANSGGLVASSLENMQNVRGEKWSGALTEAVVDRVIARAHAEVVARAKEIGRERDLGAAAILLALERHGNWIHSILGSSLSEGRQVSESGIVVV